MKLRILDILEGALRPLSLFAKNRRCSDHEDRDLGAHAGVHDLADLDVGLAALAVWVSNDVVGVEAVGVELADLDGVHAALDGSGTDVHAALVGGVGHSAHLDVV